MSKHNILVLCGGRGTRLSSVWRRPKLLAPIGNTTYLEVLLEILGNINRDHSLTLATGYRSQDIEECVEKHEGKISVLREDQELGTGGAVCNFITERRVERFSVLNGDTLFSKSDLVDYFEKVSNTNKCIFAVQRVKLNDRYGSVSKKEILSIKKPEVSKVDDFVFAGLATLNSSLLNQNSVPPFSMETLVNDSKLMGEDVELFELSTGFYDIGTPEALAMADLWLKEN